MLLMIPPYVLARIPGYLFMGLLGFPVVFLYGGAADSQVNLALATNRTFNMMY